MTLDEHTVPAEPMDLVVTWLDEARRADNPVPDAMAVATVSSSGRPSNRFVLLKGADQRGIVFFSNYASRKGEDLNANPYAAAVLFWPQPRRQIRLEGLVERIQPAESDAYFSTRDRSSRIGAIVSRQSRPVAGRAELVHAVEEYETKLAGQEPVRPQYWGGYRLMPDVVEFWSGRSGRLHDRIRYRRAADQSWLIKRLAP